MPNSTLRHGARNALNTYRQKEIMEASPQKLLLKVYDFAIQQCRLKNLEKTNNALRVLIDSLNFHDEQAREVSVGLLKLYQYAQEEMRKRNYDIVLRILTDLRDTWKRSFLESQGGLDK